MNKFMHTMTVFVDYDGKGMEIERHEREVINLDEYTRLTSLTSKDFNRYTDCERHRVVHRKSHARHGVLITNMVVYTNHGKGTRCFSKVVHGFYPCD